MSTGKRKSLAALWLVAVLALIALGLASSGIRELLAEAVATVRPMAVLATVPGQVAATLLCAAALRALRPGVTYWACAASRLLRDAGDNLLVFLPGLGEVIGARSLVLSGGRGHAAVSASALDKFAETAAQVPYIAFAVWVLFEGWHGSLAEAMPSLPSGATLALVLAGLVLLVLLGWKLARAGDGPATRLARRIREEWKLLAAEFHAQKAGFPLATALHFIAWIMGGVQVWMAARALGLDIGLYEAIAIESAAYAGRAILFFVPAGLVTQEAGLVAAGLVFGLAAPQALALALVLRLRDVLFGVPLLLWPLFEFRHGRKRKGDPIH
jgi:hypothetical protein